MPLEQATPRPGGLIAGLLHPWRGTRFWESSEIGSSRAAGEQSTQSLGYKAVGLGTSHRGAGEPGEGEGQRWGVCRWIGGEKAEADGPRGSGAQGPRQDRVRGIKAQKREGES